MDRLVPLLVLLCWTGASAIVAHGLWRFVAVSRPAARSHMDPVRGALRLVWPVVDLLQFHVGHTCPTGHLLATRQRLLHAGLQFTVSESEFIALQVLAGLAYAATGLALALLAPEALGWWAVPAGAALGAWHPLAWRRRCRRRRVAAIERALPACLDLLLLCAQGGLALTGALQHAATKLPDGPLRRELAQVLGDMRAGAGRAAALQAMALRCDLENLHHLVSGIVQAEAMGASITDTLAAAADQLRTQRFQHAEKKALEAPVKMIGPLVVFIFPVTFIVIFAPLVLEFLRNGRHF